MGMTIPIMRIETPVAFGELTLGFLRQAGHNDPA